jgi:asparagine synthase (glutamine-hydrolysing)
MCGICGVAAADPRRPIDVEIVRAMTDTLWHRGPDGEGYHVADGVGLGMRRLSIVDLATGDQPITNEDGSIVLVCNGEIYNHVELRRELERAGHRFSTRSDVEVIAHLYEDRGPACVDALRGMFAFALWDDSKRRLLLARDRLGIKPLHYAVTAGGLYFGSEAKSILASGAVDPTLDAAALHELFTFGFPIAPRTMIEAVRRLPPGHVMTYQAGAMTTSRYWDPGPPRDTEPARSADEWAEALFACLDESVRLHMRSDVPVGAWLSPGLDSSGIVALMCRHVTTRIRTFSLGFDDPDADELRAGRTLDQFGGYPLDSERAQSSDDDFARLPEALWHNEDPSTTGLEVPRLVLSELAGKRVKVVLTGEGADELFGGYFWYALDRTLAPLGRLPQRVRSLAVGARMRDRWPWASRVLVAPRALGGPRWAAMIGPPEGGLALLDPELRAAGASASTMITDDSDDVPQGHRTNTLRRLDLATRLPDLVVQNLDRQSMAASLEARVPFLDHHVVELAMRIPPSVLLRRREPKHVLRRALARVLPAELARRRKRGMTAPRQRWLRGPLPEFAVEALSPERIRATGYFEAVAVSSLLAEHRAARVNAGDVLLGVLGVQLWDSMFMHDVLRPPPSAAGERRVARAEAVGGRA